MSKHKHHDLICQWAADTSRKVEWSQNGGRTWYALSSVPLWDESVEYRFADSVLRYRVALFDDDDGAGANWVEIVRTEAAERSCEAAGNFVRWITDWTEVTEPPVEPPKTKKYERWLNLYDRGAVGAHATPADAETYAGLDRVECRRIEWEVPA